MILFDRITISLHSSNTVEARRYTNRALALGCDVNASAVTELITEIDDLKREEQEQLDREFAVQEQERQMAANRRKDEKRQQNMQGVKNLIDFFGNAIKNVEEFDKDKRTANNDNNNNTIPFPTSREIPYNPDKEGASTVGTREFDEEMRNSNKQPQNNNNTTSTQNEMSKTDCEKKFCPPCSEENNPIDLLGVQVNRQCNACRKKYKSEIENCYKGGASANSPDKNLSEFKTYAVNKCVYYTREVGYNGKYYNKKHTFYEFYGPERPNNNALSTQKITCTVISRGTWHECKNKVDKLKMQ